MKIDRHELLYALRTAQPALADKTPVTQLLCFWFSGETLFAYNDVIGISVPFKTDFQGGVQGVSLVGLVSNSKASDAEVTVEDGEFSLRLARSNAKMPTISYDQAVWELPPKSATGINLDEDLLVGFKHVMLSADDDIGISLIAQDKRLWLYSCNERTLAWSTVPSTKKADIRVEIPPTFCGQLLEICKVGGVLFIEKDFVMAVANDVEIKVKNKKTKVEETRIRKGASIFSRLIHSEKPLDYEESMDVKLPDKYQDKLVAIPNRLVGAVDRALILANGDITPVKHTIANGMLNMALDSTLGQLREQVELGKGIKYTVNSQFDVALIKKGLSKSDSILFTDDCAVLCAGENSGYVVSCSVA